MRKIKVVFFHRKPVVGSFSVEYIFNDVRSRMSDRILPVKYECKYISTGIFNRFLNIISAALQQGEINHITGDVHYLNFCMSQKKTVLTILDCVFMNKSKGWKGFLLKHFWLTIPVKKAAVITAISEATKQEILKYVNCQPDKIKVVPVAISEKFNFINKPFNSLKPVILHIGMAPNKNLLRLIDALIGLNVTLNIVGKLTDEYLNKLKESGIEYYNVYGISDDEMVEQYHQCDILSFVSTYEGFGMPILEAQATGRVVITSNLSSMPEVGGEGALYVDPFDVDSIRKGIIQLMSNEILRKELVQKGRENVMRFNPNAIAKQYEQIYLDLYKNCN